MDKVHHSIAPLSPFTWDTEEPAGSVSSANAVLHDIAELDLRFDLIVDEFAFPCRHTLHLINSGLPLQRKNLTLRQLQLLQYGVVVHGEARLVLVAVPQCCGDSGACLAASYEHLFRRSLDVASAVAHHPLLPEYTFIVYRVPKAVTEGDGFAHSNPAQRPEALFRLVYRNVNPNSTANAAADDFDAAAAPEYKLVAVLVSSSTYYGELQRVSQYRREWHAHSAAKRASRIDTLSPASDTQLLDSSALLPLPEQVAAEVRRTSSLSLLCSSFARVLERFTSMEEEIGAALSTTTAGTADHEDTENDEGVEPGLHRCGGRMLVVGDPWSYQYTRDGARLWSRLDVTECTKAALQMWRDGELDLMQTTVMPTSSPTAPSAILGAHSTHPPLVMQAERTPCTRLILLASRHEVTTTVSENEIVSFLPDSEPSPSDAAAFQGVVYRSPAAERLRRWILQGLVAAEVHGIHAVLLDLDPVSLLQPCVELLAEADGEAAMADEDEASTAALRYRRALLLVCQVAMETVERFVRHSGLVWKVTVAVREAGADSTAFVPETTSLTAWCTGLLELMRDAEIQRETSAERNTLSFTEDGDEKADDAHGGALIGTADRHALVSSDGVLASPSDLSASQKLALRTQQVVDRAVVLYNYEAAGPAAPLPLNIVAKAKAVGVTVSDADFHALFKTFCAAAKRRDALLPASALVDLLTEEWSTEASKRRRYAAVSAKRLVCPLDSCGVPVTRARVLRFLQPFLDVMGNVPSSAQARAFNGAGDLPPPALNYAQFSMIMFAIAKM